MKIGLSVLSLLVLAGAAGFAYYTISPLWRNIEMNEVSPLSEISPEVPQTQIEEGSGIVASGSFVAQAHEVEGKAQLLRAEGQHVLRFEDFQTINGPDLRIYLATDTTAEDFIDLGKIKATEGNVNYAIPEGTDTAKYDTVLVWCRAFRVLFSYVVLQ